MKVKGQFERVGRHSNMVEIITYNNYYINSGLIFSVCSRLGGEFARDDVLYINIY